MEKFVIFNQGFSYEPCSITGVAEDKTRFLTAIVDGEEGADKVRNIFRKFGMHVDLRYDGKSNHGLTIYASPKYYDSFDQLKSLVLTNHHKISEEILDKVEGFKRR